MMNKMIKKLPMVLIILALMFISISGRGSYREITPDKEAASLAYESPSAYITPSPIPTDSPPNPGLQPTPEPEPLYFSITMLGDCTLASSHGTKGGSYSYETIVGDDYAYPFAETAHLYSGSDFVIANLECALTDYNTPDLGKTFAFRGKPEYVEVLKLGSIDFVSLGNNHSQDYGQTGYEDTKTHLEAAGIGFAGRDEWSLHTTESGLVIGVYSLSFGDTAQIQAGIAALEEAGAELIIAALHWGDEGSYRTNSVQDRQSKAAIDAGAHIVMGTHPHTLQPFEEYNGGYIYYSLGNWTFGGNTAPRDRDTIIATVSIMREPGGGIKLLDKEHIPCAISGTGSYNNYQPIPYEEGSKQWLRTISKIDGSFDGPNLSVDYS